MKQATRDLVKLALSTATLLAALGAVALLSACGGGEEHPDDRFLDQALKACQERGGLKSYHVADWRDRDGNVVRVLASVVCNEGPPRVV